MSKRGSKSDVDHLRSELKKLKKELARKEKRANIPEETECADDFYDTKQVNTGGCPRCSGVLDIIGGDKIKIYICQSCSYRSISMRKK